MEDQRSEKISIFFIDSRYKAERLDSLVNFVQFCIFNIFFSVIVFHSYTPEYHFFHPSTTLARGILSQKLDPHFSHFWLQAKYTRFFLFRNARHVAMLFSGSSRFLVVRRFAKCRGCARSRVGRGRARERRRGWKVIGGRFKRPPHRRVTDLHELYRVEPKAPTTLSVGLPQRSSERAFHPKRGFAFRSIGSRL